MVEDRDVMIQHSQQRHLLRQSAVWKTVKMAIDEVGKQIERAAIPIKKYGVTPQDFARLVAEKLDIKEPGRFIDIIFHDN
jgi:uncharacterized protein YjaZ